MNANREPSPTYADGRTNPYTRLGHLYRQLGWTRTQAHRDLRTRRARGETVEAILAEMTQRLARREITSAAMRQGESQEDTMAILKTVERKKLPASEFGEPGSRKYPMPDKSHAANAKARATQQARKGNLSASQAASIKAKANRVLGKK